MNVNLHRNAHTTPKHTGLMRSVSVIPATAVTLPATLKPLTMTATGRGQRQEVCTDKDGFPCGQAGRSKRVHGFQTGDQVKLTQPKDH